MVERIPRIRIVDALRSIQCAARVWLRVPVVALAIVTLTSLGIAGVAGLFGPLYSLILSPLSLPDPDQLVRLGGRLPVFNVYTNALHEPERFQALFSHLMVYVPVSDRAAVWQVGGSDRPVEVNALAVTSEFFETLGVAPRLGRGLAGEVADASVVVVSDRLWRTAFAERPDIVGTTVEIDGRRYAVVGVMPEGFDFPRATDAWLPIGSTTYATSGMEAVARLRPGLSLSHASVQLAAMGLQPAVSMAGEFGGEGPVLQSLQVYLRGDARGTLWTLWAVSGAFLLLACVGVANLLLAHGVRRRPELLVRAALGASRGRLVLQLLTETFVLVAIGALAGLWLSRVAGQWLVAQLTDLPAGQPFMPAAVTMVVGLIVVVTVACGLAPALHASRVSGSGLHAIHATSASARSRHLLSPREGLAAVQLALALALLVGTGLLMRSLRAQVDVPLGFRADHLVTFKTLLPASPALAAADAAFRAKRGLSPNRATWGRAAGQAFRLALEPEARAEYYRNRLFVRALTERVGALPDVMTVGIVSPTPFTPDADSRANSYRYRVSSLAGSGGTHGAEEIWALGGAVSPNGFDLLGIPLVAGRSFTEEDVANAFAASIAHIADLTARRDSAELAIINDGLARRLWPRVDPVGKYFKGGDRIFVVVGVVADFSRTRAAPAGRPAVYVPFAGEARSTSVVAKLRPGASVATFAAEADQIASALQRGVGRVAVQRLDTLVAAGNRDLSLALKLLGWFAALGTLVASLGVYTAVALSAASRTRELGIRLALGASPATIRGLLLSRIARLLVAFPVGWALGWGLAKPLSHFLFQVTALDLVTYSTCGAVLLVAVIAASLGPVLRAGATDPASVLRSD